MDSGLIQDKIASYIHQKITDVVRGEIDHFSCIACGYLSINFETVCLKLAQFKYLRYNTGTITWPGTMVCVKSLFSSTSLFGVMLNFKAMLFKVSWVPACGEKDKGDKF